MRKRQVGRGDHQVVELAMIGLPVKARLAPVVLLALQAILVVRKGIMKQHLGCCAQGKNNQEKKSEPVSYDVPVGQSCFFFGRLLFGERAAIGAKVMANAEKSSARKSKPPVDE